MTEGALIDRLDRTIDAILAHRDATSALKDVKLAPLARVAAELRHYPSPQFKARLRAGLERTRVMSSVLVAEEVRKGFTTVTPYLRVGEPGLADFLARVFGAVETGATAGGAGHIHREIRVGNSMMMIAEGGPQGIVPIRPVEFHVYVENVDAVFQRAVAAGATSLGEPADRVYGERAGFVKDLFGNYWFIATRLGGSYIPEGLGTVTPFVHASGVSRYIDFLTRGLGAVEEVRQEAGGQIRLARLRIGNGAIELGEAESPGGAMPATFYLYVDDPDGLYERAISAGAKSLSAPTDHRYGERVAAVEDSIGSQWFIARPV